MNLLTLKLITGNKMNLFFFFLEEIELNQNLFAQVTCVSVSFLHFIKKKIKNKN